MNKILHYTIEHSPLRNLLIDAAEIKIKKIFKVDHVEKIKISYSKIPTLKLIFFVISNILNFKIFDERNYVLLRYKTFEIGRYAASYTYRNNKVFSSKILKVYLMIKNILIAGLVIENALRIVDKSTAIYIDHVGYLNGLYINVFSSKKKIVFFHGYPRGFSFINYNIKKNRKVNDSTIIIARPPKKKIDKNSMKMCQKKISNIIKAPKKQLDYMRYTQYSKKQLKKLDSINFKDIDYLVYAHSFVDGQLFFGYDGFTNLHDWLEFTIKKLKRLNKNVIVKAHPNFYNKILGNLAIEDSKIFESFKKKYESKKIRFIDIAVENNLILKKVSKSTIVLSHHGTAILETTFLGFKSISSYAAMWSKEFKISNQFSNIKEYERLLETSFSDLRLYKSKNLFLSLIFQMYFNAHAVYKKKHFYTIIKKISKHIGITPKKYKTNADSIMKYVDRKFFSKITKEISKNIEEILI